MLLAAVQLAPRIVIAGAFVNACGQLDVRIADQLAQGVAQIVGDLSRTVVADRRVQSIDEALGAGEIEGEHGWPVRQGWGDFSTWNNGMYLRCINPGDLSGSFATTAEPLGAAQGDALMRSALERRYLLQGPPTAGTRRTS